MQFYLTLVAKSKSEVAFKESADSDLDLALRGESGDPNARPGWETTYLMGWEAHSGWWIFMFVWIFKADQICLFVYQLRKMQAIHHCPYSVWS